MKWASKTIGIITAIVFFLFIVISVEAQGTPTITLENVNVTEGDVITADLILSAAPDGLAGYIINVTVPSILEIESVDIVEIGLERIIINGNNVRLFAADLDGAIEAEAMNITLATFNMTTVDFGSDNFILDIIQLDDDKGLHIISDIVNGSVNVARLFPILPGETERTADLDNDGLAEDLNGNGRLDFRDIILLFIHINSQEVLDNVDLFDYNINGIIDFDDVVKFFEYLLTRG